MTLVSTDTQRLRSILHESSIQVWTELPIRASYMSGANLSVADIPQEAKSQSPEAIGTRQPKSSGLSRLFVEDVSMTLRSAPDVLHKSRANCAMLPPRVIKSTNMCWGIVDLIDTCCARSHSSRLKIQSPFQPRSCCNETQRLFQEPMNGSD
jgi:hypothetical protein